MVKNEISKFVENGKIDINKECWKQLKNQFSREEIVEMISDLIIDNQIHFPFREVTHTSD